MDKKPLRMDCWQALRAAGVARFPGAVGRIPNFTGAEAAALRLADTPEWKRARTLKCNPDLPQRPVRHRALREGKRVLLAVPRLASERPFLWLDPDEIPEHELWNASSIRGAEAWGEPLGLADVGKIDLVVSGCVGVGRDGARLGKGGGYADLEFALLRETGALGARTPIATTVHPLQLLRARAFQMEAHDTSVDLVALPERLLHCPRTYRRPSKVLWDLLDDERRAAMPVLHGLERPAPGGRTRRKKP